MPSHESRIFGMAGLAARMDGQIQAPYSTQNETSPTPPPPLLRRDFRDLDLLFALSEKFFKLGPARPPPSHPQFKGFRGKKLGGCFSTVPGRAGCSVSGMYDG